MIYETTRHATELEAIAQGEAFKLSCGFGYGPSYQVYKDNITGVWVCYTMRYSISEKQLEEIQESEMSLVHIEVESIKCN